MASHKLEYDQLQEERSTELSTVSSTNTALRVCHWISYLVSAIYHGLFRLFEFFWGNKFGAFGLCCIGITIIIVSYDISTETLFLTQSRVYDYTFDKCTVNDEATMCSSYRLNHTMYFQYDGVYISPYTQNGKVEDNVFFEYDFCEQVAVPKYPSNYQRHCDLLSGGIGTRVSLVSGYTLSIISLCHCIIILCGWCPWNAFHKLNWIFVLVSSFCYVITCLIWYFIGHIDIVANNKLYSEAHAGMKVDTHYGYSVLLKLIAASLSMIAAFSLRLYVRKMKIEDFRYKYMDSETASKIMSSADWNFINGTSDEPSQSLS
eukprot:531421_1